MSWRTIFGLGATALWFAGGGYLLFCQIGWSKFWELSPSELGDFFAGFSAPLAFFWLVIGYFQQGVELKQSNETLKLQNEELKQNREALVPGID